MKPVELKVARIGNSRGVRIPAATLQRYQIGTTVVMEERSDGILLRPRRSAGAKLSWDETALAMAAEAEDWSAWEATTADGLNDAPWESVGPRRVAERRSKYPARRRSGKR
jgi:antitoxin component of MazEF toxin-antitoxin module